MAYTALLNKLIENSGLTVKEIAKRCTESGTKITAAYISTLRNSTDNRAPSDEVSKALAKVCGAKNENVLVIEAYLDTAPTELTGILKLFRDVMYTSFVGMFENKFNSQETRTIRDEIEKMPLAEFLLAMQDNAVKESIEKQAGTMHLKFKEQDKDIRITQEIKNALGFQIADNGMNPIIGKGNKVTVEMKNIMEYENGDILCYFNKGEKGKIFARKAIFTEKSRNEIMLIPINSEYQTKTVQTTDIVILGKAKQVIADIA